MIRRAYLKADTYVRLADTVGFITDLPKDLINAFRATLEELQEADLFVHVVDASNPQWPRQRDAVEAILHELDLDRTPRLLVFNKCDLAVPEAADEASALCVSAKTGAGLDALRSVADRLPDMTARIAAWIALFALFCAAGCDRNADDAFVASVQRLRPAVVLLSMRVPPENKKDRYDDAYATGFVVASGSWGSDVLTVQHAIDGAWNIHVTVANRWKAPARVVASNEDLDLALLRTPRGGRSRSLRSVPRRSCKTTWAGRSVCSAIRFPTSSTTKVSV